MMRPFLATTIVIVASLAAALPAAAEQWSGESLFHVDSQWRDEQGAKVRLSDYAGKPFLLTFFYATCETVCPMTVATLKRAVKALKTEKVDVDVVMVTLTPERDTTKELADYVKTHHLDTDRWHLITANKEGLDELAAVIDVRYRRAGKDDVVHTNPIAVVDAKGVVKAKITDAKDQARIKELAAALR